MKDYLSYSEFYLWHKNKGDYIKHYINGEELPTNDAQRLGSIIHASIACQKYLWFEELRKLGMDKNRLFKIRKAMTKLHNKRAPIREMVITATTKSGIKLLSIYDGLDKKNKKLFEYKTIDNPYTWTQRRVDNNLQLSFYAYVYKLRYFSYFNEIALYSINTKNGNVKTFKTSRGPKDVEFIADKIEQTVKEMKVYGIWDKRLSTQEIKQKPIIKMNF